MNYLNVMKELLKVGVANLLKTLSYLEMVTGGVTEMFYDIWNSGIKC